MPNIFNVFSQNLVEEKTLISFPRHLASIISAVDKTDRPPDTQHNIRPYWISSCTLSLFHKVKNVSSVNQGHDNNKDKVADRWSATYWDRLMSYVSVWRITDRQTNGNRDYAKASQKPPESTPRRTIWMDDTRLCAASQSHLGMTYSTYCAATHSTSVTSLTVRQLRDELHGDNTDNWTFSLYCLRYSTSVYDKL